MRQHYIILKEGQTFSLNQSWIQKLHDFIEIADKTHTARKTMAVQLEEWESNVFYATNLQELDFTWADVVSSLCRLGLHDNTYQFDSHNFYIFVDPEQENWVQKSFVEEPYHNYVITGNDTFLDKYGLNFFNKEKYRGAIVSDAPFPTNGYYLTVVWDYLVEYFMPTAIFNHIHNIYNSISSYEQIDLDLMKSLLFMKAKCKLTIRRSKQDAENYTKIITSYFDGTNE